jgi:hypothetical protein
MSRLTPPSASSVQKASSFRVAWVSWCSGPSARLWMSSRATYWSRAPAFSLW